MQSTSFFTWPDFRKIEPIRRPVLCENGCVLVGACLCGRGTLALAARCPVATQRKQQGLPCQQAEEPNSGGSRSDWLEQRHFTGCRTSDKQASEGRQAEVKSCNSALQPAGSQHGPPSCRVTRFVYCVQHTGPQSHVYTTESAKTTPMRDYNGWDDERGWGRSERHSCEVALRVLPGRAVDECL